MFRAFSLSLVFVVVVLFTSGVPSSSKAQLPDGVACSRVFDAINPAEMYGIISDKCQIMGIVDCPFFMRYKIYNIIQHKKNNPPANCGSLSQEQANVINEAVQQIMGSD